MKKLLIYPFTLDTLPLVRYCKMLSEYDEVIPVVEKGSGISEGTDVAHIDGGSQCGTTVTACFEEAVNLTDDILFTNEICDTENGLNYFSLAKKLNKKILVCGDLSKLLGIDHVGCKMLTYPEYTAEVRPQDSLQKIPVPVVLVMGQGQQCNKFDIQLGLKSKFQEPGYKVSQVGTKRYSALFGFHALPQFPEAPLWKKILLYNRYFKDIVNRECPDVLIVGVPGGIMPIDERHNELFGETAIAISKSLNPDVAILSLYLTKVDGEFLSDIKNYFRYALGVSPDYFHLSGTKLVFEQGMHTINFLITDSCRVFDEQEETDYRFFNIFSPESCNSAYEGVISQLQNNIEIL